MSYEDNRRDHGGEYGGYGRDRDERHGQSGQHQGRQQESGYRRDEFESYPPSRDEGNVSRGGYGRDAEGPAHGGGSHGGYGQSNLDDPESTGYDQPARNYSQRRQSNDNDDYNRDGRGRSDYDSGKGGKGGQGRNEYSPQSGRQAVGSGESYVGLGNRGGDDYRTTSDAYGGEGLTSGGDYGSSNSHQNKPQHGSGTGYSGGAGGRNESGGTGGYSAGGGGGGGGYTTGNSGNSGGRNNSSNQGTYGSMNSSNSGGTTEGSNLANWKPGQEMQFTAAEHESETNPLAKEAVGLAGQTQNFFKQGLKDMEKEVEGYVKDKLTGGSKHKNEY